MKVLMVQASSTGGVGRHVADAALGVSRRGHHVIVAAPPDARAGLEAAAGQPLQEHPTAAGLPGLVEVEITDRPRPREDTLVVTRLRRLARGADAVHAHGLRAGALAALALATDQVPLVVTLHNLPVGDRWVRGAGEVLLTIIARRAQLVLGVSRDILEHVAGRGDAVLARALVPAPLRPPVDIDDVTRVRHELVGDASADTVVLLSVARLAPQKGLDVLVEAGHEVEALLGATDRNVLLAVAGDGPLRRRLGDQAAARHVPLRLLGARDDVPALLRAADVLVVPSRWEGQPLVVQEGLRAGCAIVATDAGGTREVTDDAAVLVPPDNPQALANAVVDLVTSPGRLDEMRSRARHRAEELPTLDDMLLQLVTRYAVLAAGGR